MRNDIYKRLSWFDNFMREVRRVYFTLPFIDKITLLGDAGIKTQEDKITFMKNMRYMNVFNTDEEGIVKYDSEKWQIQKKSGYSDHFTINLKNTKAIVHLWFNPKSEGARFIKLEFSMKQLGKEGLKELIDWFDSTFVHMTFFEFASYKNCIGYFELAIDCIGLSLNDVILDHEAFDKLNLWMEKGYQETWYLDAKPKISSPLKIYLKSKECRDKEKPYPYKIKDKQEIVRIEKTISTSLSLYDLIDLKSTHFRSFPISMNLPKGNASLMRDQCFAAFMHILSISGKEVALKLLPKQKREKYKEYLDISLHDFLDDFHQKSSWRKMWKIYLCNMGLECR